MSAAATVVVPTDALKSSTSSRPDLSIHSKEYELVAPTNGPNTNESLVVASPYTAPAHLLDLQTLAKPFQFMARALTVMAPLTSSYATTAYPEAFNWDEVVSKLGQLVKEEGFEFSETSYYIIVFRSQIPPTTDRAHLGELDAEAHREAVRSGGLLKYWFGTPNVDGRNLATCLWRDRSDAKLGGAGKGHAQAMHAVRDLYTEWRVERLRFQVTAGASSWSIIRWMD